MTTTKPIASMSGRQRKLLNAAIKIAQAQGCCTKGARVSFTGSGHPRVTVKGPAGQPVTFGVSGTPRNAGDERNHMKRRLRTAIRRAEGGE